MTNTLYDFSTNPDRYLKGLVGDISGSNTRAGSLISKQTTSAILNLSVSGDAKSAVSLIRNEGRKIVNDAINKLQSDTLKSAGRNRY